MPQRQSFSSISIQQQPSASNTSSSITLINQLFTQSTKMAPLIKKYKAAAVNAEPGWLDLELSVEKTIHWINEACKLIAFPELWIPGLVPENPLATLFFSLKKKATPFFFFEKKLLATSVCTHSEEHQADV
jgi:hypothetical protein